MSRRTEYRLSVFCEYSVNILYERCHWNKHILLLSLSIHSTSLFSDSQNYHILSNLPFTLVKSRISASILIREQRTNIMRTPNIPNYLLYFRDDMRLSTWILWGACIQSLLILFLPRFLALLPAAAVLITRIITSTLRNEGFLPHSGFDKVALGRTTAQIPNADGSFSKIAGDKEIVLFIIATRSSHPKGRFAPGINEITNYFRDLWQELGRNREKWGCECFECGLLKTPHSSLIHGEQILAKLQPSSRQRRIAATLWFGSHIGNLWNIFMLLLREISIKLDWSGGMGKRSIHTLRSSTKRTWYPGDTGRTSPIISVLLASVRFPYVSFSDVFPWVASERFPGQTKHVVRDHPTDKESRLISPRIPTTGAAWKSMKSRMGRVE